MKKSHIIQWITICVFLTSNLMVSQTQYVEWKSSVWSKDDHPDPVGSQVPFPTPQNKSGEDWFYDIKTSVNSQNTVDGYIVGGYSTFVQWQQIQEEGCYSLPLLPLKYYLFESEGNSRGNLLATLAFMNLDGSKKWYKTYNEGFFYKVIQTSDGGYLAIGVTRATQKLDDSFHIYNPVNNQSSDSFKLGPVGVGACQEQVNNIRKAYVVKTDSNGNTEWEYIYGMQNYFGVGKNAFDNTALGWDAVEKSNGNFLLTGCATSTLNPVMRTFVIEIDPNGYRQWGKYYGSPVYDNIGKAIGKYNNGNNVKYIIAGEEAFNSNGNRNAFAFQINNTINPNTDWFNTYNDGVNSNPNVKVSNLEINDNTNELLLPVAVDFERISQSSTATGKIFKIDATNGQTIGNPIDIGAVKAFDLFVGITNTADGGFAVVSSKQPDGVPDSNDYPSFPANYNLDYWETDAYVAKYNASGIQEWEIDFDSETEMPPGLKNTWTFPDPDMRDLKRQECLYAIAEAPDGSFVITGNNSSNFDDSYLAKTSNTCDNLTLNGSEIDIAIDYKGNTISSSNYNVKNLGKASFTANSIELKSGFHAEYGSNLRIRIEPCSNLANKNISSSNSSNFKGDNKIELVKLYPNPTTGILNIKSELNITHWELNNFYGKQLKRDANTSKDIHMAIRDYPSGIYILRLTLETGEVISKQIIKK